MQTDKLIATFTPPDLPGSNAAVALARHARALEAQRDALAAALREFLAAVDGRYLVPSGALGSNTVKNPLAAVKATANKARLALVRS